MIVTDLDYIPGERGTAHDMRDGEIRYGPLMGAYESKEYRSVWGLLDEPSGRVCERCLQLVVGEIQRISGQGTEARSWPRK